MTITFIYENIYVILYFRKRSNFISVRKMDGERETKTDCYIDP